MCVCVCVCQSVCNSVCMLMSPLSEYNELPWASLTFHASIAPSLLLLSPKLGPINPSLPPACLFNGMMGRKGESTACMHVYLYIGQSKDLRRRKWGGENKLEQLWFPTMGRLCLLGRKRQETTAQMSGQWFHTLDWPSSPDAAVSSIPTRLSRTTTKTKSHWT